jgi:NTE family protein
MIYKLKLILIIIISTLVINGCGNKIKFNPKEHSYTPKQANFKQKNLALVLGGGGDKGFAHVGVLEELKKRG